LLAQLVWDEDKANWRFDAIAQCLPASTIEDWVRCPFDASEDGAAPDEGDMLTPAAVLQARTEQLKRQVEEAQQVANKAMAERHQLTLSAEGLHIFAKGEK